MAVDTKFAKQSFQELPPWAKGAVAIAVIGGIAIGLYAIVKALKDRSENIDDKEEQQNWSNEEAIINKDPKRRATLSPAALSSKANKLFAAMDGYGTDEEAIVAVFRSLKTDGDFIGLQKAFGIRTIDSGYLNPAPNFKGTLTAAITDEVSTYYRQRINKILTDKKIKYRV